MALEKLAKMVHFCAEKEGNMRRFSTGIVAGLICLGLSGNLWAAQEIAAINEAVEPPAIYSLELNEQKRQVRDGESLEFKGEFKDPKVKVMVEPYKEFQYGGIYLKYPQNFSFEADLSDENVKMWNLSGTNGILMIQKYSLEMDHKTMASLLVPRYGEENASVEPCQIVIDGKEVPGSRVVASFGGNSISQEVYSFKLDQGSLLLILQDNIDPKGKQTVEGLALKDSIGKTFKIVK